MNPCLVITRRVGKSLMFLEGFDPKWGISSSCNPCVAWSAWSFTVAARAVEVAQRADPKSEWGVARVHFAESGASGLVVWAHHPTGRRRLVVEHIDAAQVAERVAEEARPRRPNLPRFAHNGCAL